MEIPLENKQVIEVRENIKDIRHRIAEAACKSGRAPEEIKIMAVTKTVDPRLINVAVAEGITLLGENRVQEYLGKKDQYDPRAEVHLIGHLQKNKIKAIAPHVSMVQSVSSLDLAKKLSDHMVTLGRTMEVLLQVNIGEELSKSGFSPAELAKSLEQLSLFPAISIKGLMCIPPICQSEKFFPKMNDLMVDIEGQNRDNITMAILSMGMSTDFESAIYYGSNLVRLGTALFGSRM